MCRSFRIILLSRYEYFFDDADADADADAENFVFSMDVKARLFFVVFLWVIGIDIIILWKEMGEFTDAAAAAEVKVAADVRATDADGTNVSHVVFFFDFDWDCPRRLPSMLYWCPCLVVFS